ncbi:MAG: hypothetical protein U9N51_01815 [Bacteroidota bacterium]|nr:hypothetical protein [Bacteroidota bacterium]
MRNLFKTIGLTAFIFLLLTAGCVTTEKTVYTEKEILAVSPPVSSPAEYVAMYEDCRIPVPEDVHGVEESRKKAIRILVEMLKDRAFMEAAEDISRSSSKTIPRDELERMARKASRQYPEFLKEWKITKQEFEKRDDQRPRGEMVVSVYFKIDKKALKDSLQGSIETKELAFGEEEIMSFMAPASTPTVYVAGFNEFRMDVPEAIKDRDEARKQTVQKAINDLKMMAFQEAAEDVNHSLAQPMEKDEFERAVAGAAKNYPNFIMDWKITRQVVETRGPLSVQPETVKLSAYFRIDRRLLKKALFSGRAITPVAKYRTYVELFWNVPGKDIHPEVVDTVLATVEDYFAQKGYEVVQFEQIKGDLVRLLKKEGKKTDDLFSKDEIERFRANLELRNIDRKFVNGKSILADYANLLIGVTIKAVEQRSGMIHVRVASDATLFERGRWVSLAHSEQTASIPFVRGSIDQLTAVSGRAATKMSSKIEPKIRKKIALRKTVEEIRTGEARDFVLMFKDMNKDRFSKIKGLLRNGSKWEYKGADFPSRSIHLGYEGRIDSLAERVEIYLDGANLNLSAPEYSANGNKILFGVKN